MNAASDIANFVAYSVWHRSTDADWVAGQLSELLQSGLSNEKINLSSSISLLRERIKEEWRVTSVDSNLAAARRIIQHALDAYSPTKRDVEIFQQLLTMDADEYLRVCMQRHLARYADLGFRHSNPPNVQIVDVYPEPFQNLTSGALAPDPTDQARYGIPNAIYFRRASFNKLLANLILAHEVCHTFIADDGMIARGLEEGLADFWCYCVVGPSSLTDNIILNHFSSRRISLGRTKQRFRGYLDHFRRAYWVERENGFGALVELTRRGRSQIKRLEEKMDTANFSSMRVRRGSSKPINKSLADEIALVALEHEVHSPLALYYCMLRAGVVDVPIDKGLIAVVEEELEQNSFLLLRGANNNDVEFEDFKVAANGRWYRFDATKCDR